MYNPTILLVEDDKKLSQLITEYLSQHHFMIKTEERGDKAIYRILHEDWQLVILDINLPGLNGLQICRTVRRDFSGLILMLTASHSDEDHVTGLEYGADDYINKPIQPRVLLARIQTLLRRTHQPKLIEELIFGQLSIHLLQRTVKYKNKIIQLKPSEFNLLALLAKNAGNCLSRNNIMQILRGIDYDGIDRSIDLRISNLRIYFEDNALKPKRIQTIRNRGYLFQPNAWE